MTTADTWLAEAEAEVTIKPKRSRCLYNCQHGGSTVTKAILLHNEKKIWPEPIMGRSFKKPSGLALTCISEVCDSNLDVGNRLIFRELPQSFKQNSRDDSCSSRLALERQAVRISVSPKVGHIASFIVVFFGF